jgi:hypothetical protein
MIAATSLRMKTNQLVDALAQQAGRLLGGSRSRTEARLTLAEFLGRNHPLPEGELNAVIDGVMTLLEDDRFFNESRLALSEVDADDRR